MSTLNFNLRGINPQVMTTLKKEAKKQHISVNILILSYIEKGAGFIHNAAKPTYNDLDYLAGTWEEADAKEFKDNTQYFEKIDKDLWS